MEELKEGKYKIPEGMTIDYSSGVITIRPTKKHYIVGYRCRDCVHFATGHTTHPRWTSKVCLLKPKRIESGVQMYYHALPLGKACENFEKKEE